jgi:hypothetical protein
MPRTPRANLLSKSPTAAPNNGLAQRLLRDRGDRRLLPRRRDLDTTIRYIAGGGFVGFIQIQV